MKKSTDEYYYKGSRRMMQIMVDKHKAELDALLKTELTWLSPIKSSNFVEYQLNGNVISNVLGIECKDFEGFWPQRQPQWDGIAISKDKTLYLFEAKSHLSEISGGNNLSPNEQNSQKIENFKIKEEAIMKVAKELYGVIGKDYNWMHKYYQVANRLVFLEKMKELSPSSNYKDVKLVFINFEKDPTWMIDNKHVSRQEWIDKFKKIFCDLGNIKQKCIENGVIVLTINAESYN